MKKNIVLIGASNSRVPGGLQAGLDQDNVNLVNLSLGSTSSLHKLYSLKRDCNKEVISKADLIIIEANIVDTHILFASKLNVILRNIQFLYNELASLNNKILILNLFERRNIKKNLEAYKINNLHRYNVNKYGFNIIDIDEYIKKNYLSDFFLSPDPNHMLSSIMYQLGKNIIDNIDNFYYSYDNKEKTGEVFQIITLEDFIGKCHKNTVRDLIYKEKVCRIEKDTVLKIPNKFNNYRILGIHTFNNSISEYVKNINNHHHNKLQHSYSSLLIEHPNSRLVKAFWGYNIFEDIIEDFVIKNDTTVKLNTKYTHSEASCQVRIFNDYLNTLDYNNLISIFTMNVSCKIEFIDNKELENYIAINNKCNFSHLIPDLRLIKESIEEYNLKMKFGRISPLEIKNQELSQEKERLFQEYKEYKQQTLIQIDKLNHIVTSLPIKKQQLEISNLEQDLINKKLQTKQLSKKLGIKMNDFMPKITMISPVSAKARIQNQLSYKLGQAMIVNSKSILGYIRMPFVLSYIKDKYKQEQKIYQEKIKKVPSLKLPPLEDYPDYQEALKEKECLTYKLGQALIQANKTWYGGGVYQTAI
ncbi:hypothetical protein [Campylobacter lari]|uniref:hypothetical protein n=1 Tax=Campylobacter lari TaxID=201 RepID=UPI0021572527|nr:hypothetical protein [Campylobacter lari]MCR6777208.1 hypothetical protein [Campylobacter lari]